MSTWRPLTAPVFAASLRWYREQAGLTIAGLARRSGTDASHICDCEHGRVRRPRERTLTALADALGVPAGRLLEPPPSVPAAAGQAPAGPAAARGAPSPPPVGDSEPRNPAAAQARPAAAAGPGAPEAAVAGRGQRAASGSTTQALSGPEWRKAAKAALSAVHAAQRRGSHRRSADPYRNAVPGARKMPPGGER